MCNENEGAGVSPAVGVKGIGGRVWYKRCVMTDMKRRPDKQESKKRNGERGKNRNGGEGSGEGLEGSGKRVR